MPRGYMEGPAAEEAERRLDELERGPEATTESGSPSSAPPPTTWKSTSSAGETTSIRTSCSRRARPGAFPSYGVRPEPCPPP